MLNVGHENYVDIEKVVAIVNAKGKPISRLICRAEDEGRLVDCTNGRRTRSVIVMSSGQVVLSSVTAEALMERFEYEKGVFNK